jgi:hypothetical protein
MGCNWALKGFTCSVLDADRMMATSGGDAGRLWWAGYGVVSGWSRSTH